MDESLANYAAVLYFESRHGQTAAAQQLELEIAMPYQLFRMMGGRDGRVDRPVKDFGSQLEYAALVYGKGAYFFHALRKTLGLKTFLRFLKSYASRYGFRRADPAGLLETAARVSGKKKKIEALYRRYLQESHGDEDIGVLDMTRLSQLLSQLGSLRGFSNVKIEGTLDPAKLSATQARFRRASGI